MLLVASLTLEAVAEESFAQSWSQALELARFASMVPIINCGSLASEHTSCFGGCQYVTLYG